MFGNISYTYDPLVLINSLTLLFFIISTKPKGNHSLPIGSLVTALLIDSLPSPLPSQCYHSSAAELDHFTEAEIKAQLLKKNTSTTTTTTSIASGI